jgi:hypothetical protein
MGIALLLDCGKPQISSAGYRCLGQDSKYAPPKNKSELTVHEPVRSISFIWYKIQYIRKNMFMI